MAVMSRPHGVNIFISESMKSLVDENKNTPSEKLPFLEDLVKIMALCSDTSLIQKSCPKSIIPRRYHHLGLK